MILIDLFYNSFLFNLFIYWIIFCFIILLLRYIFIKDPLFLLLPPLRLLKARFTALLSPFLPYLAKKNPFPWGPRLFMLFRNIVYMLNQPLWTVLWTIDDFLFPGYKSEKINSPVFLVGGFRTGSTSLHRSLSLDKERFFTPRFLELAIPLISFYKFLGLLEWCDKKFNTKFINKIENMLKNYAGPEVMARHPMTYWEAEEDDALLAVTHWAGWYSVVVFPDQKTWIKAGQIDLLDKKDQKKMFTLYKRVIQKVAYYRAKPGQMLLSKNHLINFMDIISKEIPDSKFVGMARHPKKSFVSWVSLQQFTSKFMAHYQFPPKLLTSVHFTFWKLFFEKEMEFFHKGKYNNNNDDDDSRRTMIRFNDFIKNQENICKSLYEKWDWTFDNTPFEQRLKDHNTQHKKYKQIHKYTNPTLEELNVTEEQLNTLYADYIEAMGLDD